MFNLWCLCLWDQVGIDTTHSDSLRVKALSCITFLVKLKSKVKSLLSTISHLNVFFYILTRKPAVCSSVKFLTLLLHRRCWRRSCWIQSFKPFSPSWQLLLRLVNRTQRMMKMLMEKTQTVTIPNNVPHRYREGNLVVSMLFSYYMNHK